jgi:hypothetical protein
MRVAPDACPGELVPLQDSKFCSGLRTVHIKTLMQKEIQLRKQASK